MTNVDFFRAFAADTTDKLAYYFEHSRVELDFSNLYGADSADDTQVKMFHYTVKPTPRKNESGRIEGTDYEGSIFFVIKSDLDEVIDTQVNTDSSDGKYELRVKQLIDEGGIADQICKYNVCNDHWDLNFESGMEEIYNVFDDNFDGIIMTYNLYIRKLQ